MKLLLTTPDALIDKSSGDFFDGVLPALNRFTEREDHMVVVASRSGRGLNKIPQKLNPLHLRDDLRGSPRFIEFIKREFDITTADIIVLGCKYKDLQQAANSKLLLLRADYAKANNPDDTIYSKDYGIGLVDGNDLGELLSLFAELGSPWYYRLQVSEKTTIYALTDANTKNKNIGEANLNNRFKRCLKEGQAQYRAAFMIHFLVSSYGIVKEFEQVNYWGIYPSSSTDINKDLEYFKEKARMSYNGKSNQPILIRTKAVLKRHQYSTQKRIDDGCDQQLDSIILNPYYKNKLKGKTVCIIDDFTTYGTSCETARALLEEVGVKKVIFIALGKFGRDYYRYNYTISGDPFGVFKYVRTGELEYLRGDFNTAANFEFIKNVARLT